MSEFVTPKEWSPPYVTEKGFSACDFPACFCPPEGRCRRKPSSPECEGQWYLPLPSIKTFRKVSRILRTNLPLPTKKRLILETFWYGPDWVAGL